MIVGIIMFFVGGLFGIVAMSLAVVSGDAERCAECMRARNEQSRD